MAAVGVAVLVILLVVLGVYATPLADFLHDSIYSLSSPDLASLNP